MKKQILQYLQLQKKKQAIFVFSLHLFFVHLFFYFVEDRLWVESLKQLELKS